MGHIESTLLHHWEEGNVVLRLHREGKGAVEKFLPLRSDWTIEHLYASTAKAFGVDVSTIVNTKLAASTASHKLTLAQCGVRPGDVIDFELTWTGDILIHTDNIVSPVRMPTNAHATLAQLLFDFHAATGTPVSACHVSLFRDHEWVPLNDMGATLGAVGLHPDDTLRLRVDDAWRGALHCDDAAVTIAAAAAASTTSHATLDAVTAITSSASEGALFDRCTGGDTLPSSARLPTTELAALPHGDVALRGGPGNASASVTATPSSVLLGPRGAMHGVIVASADELRSAGLPSNEHAAGHDEGATRLRKS